MARIARVLPVLFLLAFSAAAQEADLINPDRPGLADGSATVRQGSWQIELGLQSDELDDDRLLSTPLLLRFGVLENLELRVETDGYLSADDANGFAPIGVGFKYRFAENYGVIVGISPPSGTSEFESDETSGDVRLAADYAYGEKWAFNPNIGVAIGEDSTSLLAALTVQYNVSPTLNVFADAGSSGSDVMLDAGVAWILAPDTQLDTSIGWGANGDVADGFVAIGWSRRF